MLDENYSIDQIHDLTKIDKWFLYKLSNMVNVQRELQSVETLEKTSPELLREAKKKGFSDSQIAGFLKNTTEEDVRKARKNLNIIPVVKRIDTVAAEYPTTTNY